MKKMINLEYTEDGRIKDFSVEDAHTLYVTAVLRGDGKDKPVKREAITMPSMDFLDELYHYTDPNDGLVAGEKWAIDAQVIKDLKSKGEAQRFIPGHPLVFYYRVRKVANADNLRHKG
jgi:hypothetical protein